MKSKPSTQKITSVDTVLNFGKHKGETVEKILMETPSYFIWLVENDVVDLQDDELLWMAELNNQDFPRFGMSIWDFIGDD